MHFVLDENIPYEIKGWLEGKGHQVSCLSKGISDEKIALITQKQLKGILLTQDRHFTNTTRFPPKDFFGIIRIRIHPAYIEDITFALDKLLNIFYEEKQLKGKLIILGKYGFFKLKE